MRIMHFYTSTNGRENLFEALPMHPQGQSGPGDAQRTHTVQKFRCAIGADIFIIIIYYYDFTVHKTREIVAKFEEVSNDRVH